MEAITYSACFYVFRCLLAEDVPATAGLMRPIRLIAPEGTVVNARPPAAVAGGNVETSQRIVDVLLACARASAAGPDSCSFVGHDEQSHDWRHRSAHERSVRLLRNHRRADQARIRAASGASGIHTHMTNSLNTPAEALEYAYPFRITRYGLRRKSGGEGEHAAAMALFARWKCLRTRR